MRVEIFSVMRWYSSSPSLRCAFCIGLSFRLCRRLGEHQGLPIGVDQPQLVRPPLAVMHDLSVSIDFNESGYMLDRSPACNVPLFALTEDAIQKASCAQESDMASMQRCDGASGGHVFVRHEE